MSNGSPWGPHADLDSHTDLDSYGQEAAPRHAFTPNTESLSPGDYDCEFVEAALENRRGHKVCATKIRLLSHGGRIVEHTYWLNRQESVNGFLAEMAALNFPATTWGNGPGKVKLSDAIPAAVAKLPGIKFRATKSKREDTRPEKKGTFYHDWFINGRIGGAAMPAVSPAAAAAQPQQQQPNGAPVTAAAGYDPNDIPF